MSIGEGAASAAESAAANTDNGASPATHVGQALRRKEDPRLITGQGTYVDDVVLPGQLWAAWVRSPEAHAKITRKKVTIGKIIARPKATTSIGWPKTIGVSSRSLSGAPSK